MKREKTHGNNTDLTANPQLERDFISALLFTVGNTGYVRAIKTTLIPDDFTSSIHRSTWEAAVALSDEGKEVNAANIASQMQQTGNTFEWKLYVTTKQLGDLFHIAHTLHEMGQRRRMVCQVEDIWMGLLNDSEYNSDNAAADMEALIKENAATGNKQVKAWAVAYRELLQTIGKKMNGEIPEGTPSGFNLIDNKGGLERGTLMVVAGRTSNGKSSLALCMALNAAKAGVPVGIFPYEMTTENMAVRLTSLMSGVNGMRIKKATELLPGEIDKITTVTDELPLYFNEQKGNNITNVIANIKAMREARGVEVVIVDYLQRLNARGQNKAQEIGYIAQSLQNLAVELNICIILISQMRRNTNVNDPTPYMEELKESGDIADAADSIYLIYRPEQHGADFKYPSNLSQDWSGYSITGTALLMCKKNRNGETGGEQMLHFDAKTTRFYQGGVFEVGWGNTVSADEIQDEPF